MNRCGGLLIGGLLIAVVLHVEGLIALTLLDMFSFEVNTYIKLATIDFHLCGYLYSCM